jgi:hypothetical protein
MHTFSRKFTWRYFIKFEGKEREGDVRSRKQGRLYGVFWDEG